MHRVLVVLAAGSLILSTGLAFAKERRPHAEPVAHAAIAARQQPAIDPNSDYAKNRAALDQGFAPVNTSTLGRGFNR
jgi:hypothetical protein